MSVNYSKDSNAEYLRLVMQVLQNRYVSGLTTFVREGPKFIQWHRKDGMSGGGERFVFSESLALASGSINFSQVHNEMCSEGELAEATALSAIVHPKNPRLPSSHLHLSYTKIHKGKGFWRLMADLNPSIKNEAHKIKFDQMLENVSGEFYFDATENGNKYFYIPSLKRSRGISHFYLETSKLGDFEEGLRYTEEFGIAVITSYLSMLMEGVENIDKILEDEISQQLAYHTLYLYQVLLMDRGTTAGLLVHDQNDLGVLASLPPRVDKNLLHSWISRLTEPQDILLERLIALMPNIGVVEITDSLKKQFAQTIRQYYHEYPDAKSMQAYRPLDDEK